MRDMANPDVDEFEGRPTLVRETLVRGRTKTLAWRRSDGTTKVDTDLELPARSGFDARYAEQALLGEGGMGRVTRCEDRQIGRHVAVKRLLDERQDTLEQRRFLREARVQAQLEHPAVVPVYDLGLDRSGQPWFAMKRVSGVTLAEVIDELARCRDEGRARPEAWGQRRLLTALSQVCLAVDFAHGRGVLHRDLKPENVMLGDYGEVYVLDWGLAKQFERDTRRPSDPEGTQPGAVLGTPGFMSPEQVRGMPLDARAEVYALGAILFELLTLEPLQPIAEVSEMLRAVVEGLVEPRPSVRTPTMMVSPELEAIIVRALDPNPDARYPSARAMSEAIEAVLDGQRDMELRGKLATEHADTATRLLAAGRRREAMASIGRALALEPDDPRALALFRDLLTQPPEQRPPEVDAALERSMAQQRAWAGRVAAIAYPSFLLFIPLLWWAGLRSLSAALPFFAAMLVVGLLCHFASRTGEAKRNHVLVIMLVSNIGIAALSTLFGPLVLLPTVAAVNTTAYALIFTGWRRVASALAGILALVVPLGLQLAGVVEPSYAFVEGQMHVLPMAIELHELPTMLLLAASGAASVVTGAVTVGRLRTTLLEAEERLFTYTWQIQQLLPESAQLDQQRL